MIVFIINLDESPTTKAKSLVDILMTMILTYYWVMPMLLIKDKTLLIAIEEVRKE